MIKNIERMPVSAPAFVHLFHEQGQPFAYDVNTNQVLMVEPVLGAVLEVYGHFSGQEILEKLSDRFDAAEIQEAMTTICDAQASEGLFLPRSVSLVAPKIAPTKETPHDQGLRHLVLTVTDGCNLRCQYCYLEKETRFMKASTALTAIEYFLARSDDNHQPIISFYGGEPLLAKELVREVVQSARCLPGGDRVLFVIDTNATLLDVSLVEWLAKEGIHLQVSLDGPREIHDRHRIDGEGQPSFDRVMSGLDLLLARDRGAADRISFVATLTPGADLKAIADFFGDFPLYRHHGVSQQPRVRVNRADLSGQNWPAVEQGWALMTNQLVQAKNEYLAAVKNQTRNNLSPVVRALFEPAIIQLFHRNTQMLGSKFVPGGNCQPGIRKLHVSVEGQFQPCERTGNGCAIGHVSRGMVLGQLAELQQNFHDGVHWNCEECWALRVCGVCYAVHARANSANGRLETRICEQVRWRKESDLGLLAQILLMPEACRSWLDETMVD